VEGWVTFVPLAVALIAPVGAYLVAARKMSGRIASSEASQLWDESRSIRDDYRGRLQEANARIAELEGQVAVLQRDLREAERRLARGEW